MKHWIEPDWPVPKNIRAACTLRSGGVSQDAFASLNVAYRVGDKRQNVGANRNLVRQMLALPTTPVWLQQVHSNRAVNIDDGVANQPADASFTHQPRTVCAILSADCLPLLLATSDGRTVAAIHAGWKGLLAGIISTTVAALNRRDVLVWLGPAIGADCFVVGDEVRAQFVSKSPAFGAAFKRQDQQHYLANIYQLATIELAALGITKVYGGGLCTVTDSRRFYSHRREGKTGRMATLIWRS